MKITGEKNSFQAVERIVHVEYKERGRAWNIFSENRNRKRSNDHMQMAKYHAIIDKILILRCTR